VTTPGLASGSTTLSRTLKRPRPSMSAASSISLGMLRKYPDRIYTAKARLNAE